MRSKVTWWSLVVLLAVLYGFVGLAATFASAFESIFDRRDSLSILHSSGQWIVIVALSMFLLTFMAGCILSAFSRERAAETCIDLMRLHVAAVWGGLIPFACGSDRPWIFAPLAIGVSVLGLAVDRKGPGDVRPWQTWALLALILLVAAPVLSISRL